MKETTAKKAPKKRKERDLGTPTVIVRYLDETPEQVAQNRRCVEAALDMIATVEAATEDPETLKDMDAARSFLDQESIPEDALHELVESLKEQCTVIYAF